MKSIRLIHWKPEEVEERVARLRKAGYTVDAGPFTGLKGLERFDALLIDLTRLPSQGRDLALAIRERKATRHLPLVFLEGNPEKVERSRQLLPDAGYASWRGVRGATKRALAAPPTTPVVPGSRMAGYSSTPLPKKLGLKPGMTVALLGAPTEFENLLPGDLTLRRQARGRCDLAIWFPRSRTDLERRIEQIAALSDGGDVWVAWPKRASGVKSDLTQIVVRRVGLDRGLVDYKVCAIDATYTGLRFTRRARA
jgi:CheY-like chemotaxis protein